MDHLLPIEAHLNQVDPIGGGTEEPQVPTSGHVLIPLPVVIDEDVGTDNSALQEKIHTTTVELGDFPKDPINFAKTLASQSILSDKGIRNIAINRQQIGLANNCRTFGSKANRKPGFEYADEPFYGWRKIVSITAKGTHSGNTRVSYRSPDSLTTLLGKPKNLEHHFDECFLDKNILYSHFVFSKHVCICHQPAERVKEGSTKGRISTSLLKCWLGLGGCNGYAHSKCIMSDLEIATNGRLRNTDKIICPLCSAYLDGLYGKGRVYEGYRVLHEGKQLYNHANKTTIVTTKKHISNNNNSDENPVESIAKATSVTFTDSSIPHHFYGVQDSAYSYQIPEEDLIKCENLFKMFEIPNPDEIVPGAVKHRFSGQSKWSLPERDIMIKTRQEERKKQEEIEKTAAEDLRAFLISNPTTKNQRTYSHTSWQQKNQSNQKIFHSNNTYMKDINHNLIKSEFQPDDMSGRRRGIERQQPSRYSQQIQKNQQEFPPPITSSSSNHNHNHEKDNNKVVTHTLLGGFDLSEAFLGEEKSSNTEFFDFQDKPLYTNSFVDDTMNIKALEKTVNDRKPYGRQSGDLSSDSDDDNDNNMQTIGNNLHNQLQSPKKTQRIDPPYIKVNDPCYIPVNVPPEPMRSMRYAYFDVGKFIADKKISAKSAIKVGFDGGWFKRENSIIKTPKTKTSKKSTNKNNNQEIPAFAAQSIENPFKIPKMFDESKLTDSVAALQKELIKLGHARIPQYKKKLDDEDALLEDPCLHWLPCDDGGLRMVSLAHARIPTCIHSMCEKGELCGVCFIRVDLNTQNRKKNNKKSNQRQFINHNFGKANYSIHKDCSWCITQGFIGCNETNSNPPDAAAAISSTSSNINITVVEGSTDIPAESNSDNVTENDEIRVKSTISPLQWGKKLEYSAAAAAADDDDDDDDAGSQPNLIDCHLCGKCGGPMWKFDLNEEFVSSIPSKNLFKNINGNIIQSKEILEKNEIPSGWVGHAWCIRWLEKSGLLRAAPPKSILLPRHDVSHIDSDTAAASSDDVGNTTYDQPIVAIQPWHQEPSVIIMEENNRSERITSNNDCYQCQNPTRHSAHTCERSVKKSPKKKSIMITKGCVQCENPSLHVRHTCGRSAIKVTSIKKNDMIRNNSKDTTENMLSSGIQIIAPEERALFENIKPESDLDSSSDDSSADEGITEEQQENTVDEDGDVEMDELPEEKRHTEEQQENTVDEDGDVEMDLGDESSSLTETVGNDSNNENKDKLIANSDNKGNLDSANLVNVNVDDKNKDIRSDHEIDSQCEIEEKEHTVLDSKDLAVISSSKNDVIRENEKEDKSNHKMALPVGFRSSFDSLYNSHRCCLCGLQVGIAVRCAAIACTVRAHPACAAIVGKKWSLLKTSIVCPEVTDTKASPELLALLCPMHSNSELNQ